MNKKVSYMLSLLLAGTLFTSCKNGDAVFDDYEGGTTVYFAYQYPVRTIVLGDDDYDLTLDHSHKCKIMATFGGSYEGSNGSVTVALDPTLVNNLTFQDGTPVKVMPERFYNLVTYPTWNFDGTMNGGTVVELTDDFFSNEDAVKNTYVIPLVITDKSGFGKVLTGTLKEGGQAIRTDESQWDVQPKDFVLYCVKYQNKYSGYWLTNGNTSIDNIERANVAQIVTKSLNTCTYTVKFQRKYQARTYDDQGQEVPKWEDRTLTANLQLTFDGNEQCTITSQTLGYTATGAGTWTDNGAKNSWNDKDRDLLELNYTIDFGVDDYGNHIEGAAVHEKLVWQRSGVKVEEFSPIYNK